MVLLDQAEQVAAHSTYCLERKEHTGETNWSYLRRLSDSSLVTPIMRFVNSGFTNTLFHPVTGLVLSWSILKSERHLSERSDKTPTGSQDERPRAHLRSFPGTRELGLARYIHMQSQRRGKSVLHAQRSEFRDTWRTKERAGRILRTR
jgi:hypothetical protein